MEGMATLETFVFEILSVLLSPRADDAVMLVGFSNFGFVDIPWCAHRQKINN